MDVELYEYATKTSQQDLELNSVNKLTESIDFEKALFSNDILCCLPNYTSWELLNYINEKTNQNENTMHMALSNNSIWTVENSQGRQIHGNWKTVIHIANEKRIPTAVCCFIHGEDDVFNTFLKNFKGETLVLISDTDLFESYYGCEYVHEWHLVKDISIGSYLHMLVFTRHALDLAVLQMI